MKLHFTPLLLFIFLLVSCSDDDSEPAVISNEAQDFLDEMLDIMESNSINKNEIDWSNFRQDVLERAGNAQNIKDTYPAIKRALRLLNDNHSIYRGADGTVLSEGSIRCNFQNIDEASTPETIGYVRVTAFSGSSNSSEAISFAKEIQDQIRSQDNSNTEGWIIDLRGNSGGNMWPMLAGVGPVLGEGTAGYFIDADDIETSWGYQNGASVSNGNLLTQLDDFYTLITDNPKVAVLLDNGIASSGEVMAISFIGRENTRSFGTPTCGLSTANSRFNLSDGSVLNLTAAFLADRNKNKFGMPVEPDEVTADEDIIQRAVNWLEN